MSFLSLGMDQRAEIKALSSHGYAALVCRNQEFPPFG